MTDPSKPFELSEHLRRIAAISPEAGCLVFNGTWWSWADETRLLDELEVSFQSHGVAPDAQVGILLRNRPGPFLATRCVLTGGRTIVTLNAAQGDTALLEEIRKLRLPAIAGTNDDWNRPGFLEAAAESGTAAMMLPDAPGEELRTIGSSQQSTAAATPDVAVVMLTSGTTGPPKRVPLERERLEKALAGVAHYRRKGTGALQLETSPAILWASLGHIGGLYFAILNKVQGRPVVLLERFNPESWAEAIETYQIKSGSLAPTAMRMLLDADIPASKLKSLRAVLSGTAALPVETWEEFEKRYGIPVLPTYGSTEMAGAVVGWTRADHEKFIDTKRSSAGRAFPGIELRTLDRVSLIPLPIGEVGVLEIRGAQVPANQADGWMRTTDLAQVDEDGFLFLHGRTDDVINRGGFKVSTGVVAGIIKQHPAVKDASVVGLEDDRLGMVPAAAVELRDGQTATPEELYEFVRARTTSYQCPTSIRIVDELPRTASLKISAQDVRKILT